MEQRTVEGKRSEDAEDGVGCKGPFQFSAERAGMEFQAIYLGML